MIEGNRGGMRKIEDREEGIPDNTLQSPDTGRQVLLDVRSLKAGYAAAVLNGISFTVESGQLMAVLGANGAGKSTLLKSILGLHRISDGAISIEGMQLKSLPRKKLARLVGYVPQETTLQFPFTVLEFVLQGRFAQGHLIGFESEEDIGEAERALMLTETRHLADRLINELSGGERQRVMLARALAARPRLLVLDEPVANLDISHQVKLFELIQRLTVEEGLGAIVVTHELNLAADFATRVLLLQDGVILACGMPVQVMTEENLYALFGANLMVDTNPLSGLPRITIKSSQSRADVLRQQK
jgi:iron complex transport system ATP-binding protein